MTAHEARQMGVPAGYRIYPSDVKENDLLLREEPVVHGGDVADAQAAFDQRTNLPIVTFHFNAAGANKFASFTRNNVGRPFAVVVDGRVVTAPVIQTPILGGVGQISGNFTPASAAQLAARIRSGTCVEFSGLPGLGFDNLSRRASVGSSVTARTDESPPGREFDAGKSAASGLVLSTPAATVHRLPRGVS
jgi:hypothetical protein